MTEQFRPSVRARRVARTLQRWRERIGMKGIEAAKLLGCSHAKISRIEHCVQPASPIDVLGFAIAYKVDDKERDALFELAHRAKDRGWWEEFGKEELFEAALDYVELESEACLVRSFTIDLVPGLFQTPEYTEALVRASRPHVSEEVVERRIEARRERQSLLERDKPLRVEAVFNEVVLRQVVGGPGVMRRQLEHLVELAERPNVMIQVIPFSAGAHPAMGSVFNILSFEQEHYDDVLYIESLAYGFSPEDQEAVDAYTLNFVGLQETALDADASAKMIAEAADSL
ncbi:transcriptional regulator [Longimycelium tulufanense]|uniref:Transcriptional regulator n=1 Tax=Longimycelium tulufanense TaxID=907463 RepID=A0A8J3C8C5_9PSEU|nr:helix-turn-helix transcriptional regulator [Longimycelium tulufanense]GGM53605.1 transcriptional regulator [Longimycelium tulufanense]